MRVLLAGDEPPAPAGTRPGGGVLFSITQLTAGTDISRQAVSKHLQVLAAAGLVHDLRSGRERLWQFDATQLEEARRSLDLIGRQWEQALGKLKRFVEDGPA